MDRRPLLPVLLLSLAFTLTAAPLAMAGVGTHGRGQVPPPPTRAAAVYGVGTHGRGQVPPPPTRLAWRFGVGTHGRGDTPPPPSRILSYWRTLNF